jgi:hypothetical protein
LHSGELLRNVFQEAQNKEAQNKFGSLKIISYPIISDRLYTLKILISAQKFGNLKTPDAQKDLGETFSRMPTNMLGSYGILRTKKKVISAQNIWAPLGKTLMLKKNWAF